MEYVIFEWPKRASWGVWATRCCYKGSCIAVGAQLYRLTFRVTWHRWRVHFGNQGGRAD